MAHQLVLLPERKRKQQKTRPREECVFPKVTEQARGGIGHLGVLTKAGRVFICGRKEHKQLEFDFWNHADTKVHSTESSPSSLTPRWT